MAADALLSSLVGRVEAVEADGWALSAEASALEAAGGDGGTFGDADTALLAAALKSGNRRLRRLSLCAPRCSLGASGARDLSEALAANGALRAAFQRACAQRRLRLVVPALELCGDNAAIIAFAGNLRLARGERDALTLDADPNLPLGAGPNRAPRRKKRTSPRR